jgi:uncharacterized protein (DUF1015 family)
MAVIKPFKALRPEPHLVAKVAALPYDVVSTQEARKMVRGNEYSFLHVDKPEVDLEESIDPYDPRVYEKARENLNKMVRKGIFVEDKDECYYIYRLIREGRIQTGLVACVSIDDYLNNVIKKHEHTLARKEQDRINHVNITNAHTGPILMAYRKNEEISGLIDEWVSKNAPLYDFASEDGVVQTIWVVDDVRVIGALTALFSRVPSLYIADGHHRAAAAVKVGQMRRAESPDYEGTEEFNFFLSVLFPDEELTILEYNRLIKDLNGLAEEELLMKLAEKFEVIPRGKHRFKPTERHTFGMYMGGMWYTLEAKPGTFNESDPVERLDVSILHNNIIIPILGIEDPRTDKRIDFVGGIRGPEELERRVDSGEMKLAFSMYPTSMEDLMSVADAGRIMPPKSTWFEPKLRSGIFIHNLA